MVKYYGTGIPERVKELYALQDAFINTQLDQIRLQYRSVENDAEYPLLVDELECAG